jgi:hypothetical protein
MNRSGIDCIDGRLKSGIIKMRILLSDASP